MMGSERAWEASTALRVGLLERSRLGTSGAVPRGEAWAGLGALLSPGRAGGGPLSLFPPLHLLVLCRARDPHTRIPLFPRDHTSYGFLQEFTIIIIKV